MFKKQKTPLVKKLWQFAIKNWFLGVFFACIAFVGVVSVYRLFVKKPHFVYAKVKISQGLWWASSQKPPVWFLNVLKKGDEERDFAGEATSRILNVRYYPYYASSQYDIYLDLKLKVSSELKSGNVNFARSPLAVGTAVDFTFPQTEFSATVIEISATPFTNKRVWKTVTLVKNNAQPWEAAALKVGDTYFDGTEKVLEILNVQTQNTLNPEVYPAYIDPLQIVTVTAKIKGQLRGADFLFGEEQIVRAGQPFIAATQSYYFADFKVAAIQ